MQCPLGNGVTWLDRSCLMYCEGRMSSLNCIWHSCRAVMRLLVLCFISILSCRYLLRSQVCSAVGFLPPVSDVDTKPLRTWKRYCAFPLCVHVTSVPMRLVLNDLLTFRNNTHSESTEVLVAPLDVLHIPAEACLAVLSFAVTNTLRVWN